jgi:hypothetical protein
MTRVRKLSVAAVTFVVLIVAARIAAPYLLVRYVNQTLDELDGYSGHVREVDLHIWRGAYQIEDVRIFKTAGKQAIPLFAARTVDISVQWKALLDGAIVAEIDLFNPQLNFVAEPPNKKEPGAEAAAEERDKQRVAHGQESTWQKQVKELVPLKINRVGITNGEIHYRDPHADPHVDVLVQSLYGEVDNLTNSQDLSKSLVATASFRGRAQRSGKLRIDGSLDPYAKQPTFNMKVALENLQVKELNDFLKAYANVDAEKGRISVYAQLATRNGRFKGYIKPIVRDLRVIRWKTETEGFVHKLWEGVVEVASEIIENHKKEQIATKIPLEGKLDQPRADVVTTVLFVLKNAFIEALKRGLEREVSLGGAMTADKGDD